jgi:hypothetical protein
LDPIHTTNASAGPRLFTRAEALKILRVGETTLHWLQRTGKLKHVRIGARVLFSAAEIAWLASRGATLTDAEKQSAAKHRPKAAEPPLRRRGRPRKTAEPTPLEVA